MNEEQVTSALRWRNAIARMGLRILLGYASCLLLVVLCVLEAWSCYCSGQTGEMASYLVLGGIALGFGILVTFQISKNVRIAGQLAEKGRKA